MAEKVNNQTLMQCSQFKKNFHVWSIAPWCQKMFCPAFPESIHLAIKMGWYHQGDLNYINWNANKKSQNDECEKRTVSNNIGDFYFSGVFKYNLTICNDSLLTMNLYFFAACGCVIPGSRSKTCNKNTGQCPCYNAYNGRTCNDCKSGHRKASNSRCCSDEEFGEDGICKGKSKNSFYYIVVDMLRSGSFIP